MKKFRGALFGFNREDVLTFVVESREAENKNRKKIESLESVNEELEADIEQLKSLNDEIFAKLSIAEEKIKDFEQREESLTRLSESIGRLYLVAQANANAVINAANENVELSKNAVEQNISVASSAEAELSEISRILNEKTKAYTDEIAALEKQIADARERIIENKAEIAHRQTELESITASVE